MSRASSGKDSREAAEEGQRSGSVWRRSSSTLSPVSPSSWALQFGVKDAGPESPETHPLMADPPQDAAGSPEHLLPPSAGASQASSADGRRASFRVRGESLPAGRGEEMEDDAVPVASASSAASMTASPGTTSRRRPGPNAAGISSNDDDDDDWGESSADNDSSNDFDPALAFKKLIVSDPASDIANLQKLMREGSWRAVADRVKDIRKRSSPATEVPDLQLVFATFHVLALMKLRNYPAAQTELSTLGDLSSPNYRFESHPHLYANKSGSMVPFGLRWIHAELPHRLGQTSTTVDRMYDLLAHCNERLDFLQKSVQPTPSDQQDSKQSSGERFDSKDDDDVGRTPPLEDEEALRSSDSFTSGHNEESASETRATLDKETSPPLEDVGSNVVSSGATLDDDDFGEFVTSAAVDEEAGGNIVLSTLIQRWRRRQEVVLCSVLSHHLDQKDFLVCIKWLEDLIKKRPQDVRVLSKYGYVQLQFGDLYGARRTFATVESICERTGKSSLSPGLVGLLSRNRGLLYFSLKQYTKAAKEFDAALQSDMNDIVSANNKALCLMYFRDLAGATHSLETILQTNPAVALNETVVLNLCSMYELASMNSIEAKKSLSDWIIRLAPDDFDLTCTCL